MEISKSNTYTKQTILDYITGNDKDYKIDILESNPHFMYEVLKRTKDPKMLRFCNEILFDDPIFIQSVMTLFKKDKLFCIKLATSYIKKYQFYFDNETTNVAILAEEINDGDFEEEFLPIAQYLMTITNEYMIGGYVQQGKNFKFSSVLTDYRDEPIIKQYFAKKFLNELYEKIFQPSMESYFKSKYRTPNVIKKTGIKDSLILTIQSYDEYLGNYVLANLHLISKKIKELELIVKQWEEEIQENDQLIYEFILDFYNNNPEITLDELLNYAADKFNIPRLKYYTLDYINDDLLENGYDKINLDDEEEDESYNNIVSFFNTAKEKILSDFKEQFSLFLCYESETNEIYNRNKNNKVRTYKKVVNLSDYKQDI